MAELFGIAPAGGLAIDRLDRQPPDHPVRRAQRAAARAPLHGDLRRARACRHIVLALVHGRLLAAVIPGLASARPRRAGTAMSRPTTSTRPRRRPARSPSIAVAEGQSVKQGDVLFVLDQSQQQAQYDAAEARARCGAGDAAEPPDRQPAGRDRRDAGLARQGAGPTSAGQHQSGAHPGPVRSRASRRSRSSMPARPQPKAAQAAVDQLQAQLKVAQLPARDAQQIAAEASLHGRRGRRPDRQGRARPRAPSRRPRTGGSSGCSSRPARSPVPACRCSRCSGGDALKIEFYVNEADREQFALGQTGERHLRRLRRRAHGDDQLFRLRPAVHAADHLFARRAQAAGVPHRGGDGPAERHSAGPAGERRACAMSDAPVIDVKGLTKRFGERTVVDHFDIRVPKGAIYGFLGPNGSGKTTTIRMLCGLLTPDAGEGTCLGFDVRHDAARIKEQVGYMTQKFSLLRGPDDPREPRFRRPHVPARSPQGSGSIRRSPTSGSPTGRSNSPGSLSGGWKQRLALDRVPAARAAIAAARRADGRRRSQGAPRFLGRDPPAQRARASRCWSRRTTWTRRCSAISSPTSPTARS